MIGTAWILWAVLALCVLLFWMIYRLGIVPFDVNAANTRLQYEAGQDYATDNTNGNGTLGNPIHTANGTGADAVVTLDHAFMTDTARQRWHLGWVLYSYAATPTGGRLRIKDTTTNDVLADIDIPAAGEKSLLFLPALRSKPGSTIEVRLFSGGGAVVGKVNVGAWVLA